MPQVWHQHAGTASRSGTSSVLPSTSWAWQWSLGPDSSGAVAGAWTGTTPAQAFPVCGNGRIYRPLGSSGLNARSLSSGTSSWTNTDATFNGPAAYDHRTDCVIVGGSNGTLYRIDASTGTTTASVSCGSAITTAVALRGDYAYVVCADGGARKVRVSTMAIAWTYTGGSSSGQAAQSHPAVGVSSGLTKLVYATADGYVHAVDDLTGAASWRVKPYSQTWTSDHSFLYSWPVIAPRTGVVLIRCQLPQISGGGALTAGPSSSHFPNDTAANAGGTIRTWLGTRASPGTGAAYANLFALSWAAGAEAFVPAVGYCSTEDYRSSAAYGVMGMQPVVKTYSNGDEVAYIQFRNTVFAAANGWDLDRWSGVLGEMVLDSATVSPLVAGDVRFVEMGDAFSGNHGYMRIVDESCPITVAGGDLPAILHAHWAASEAVVIADRSDSLGLTGASPIDTTELPVVIRANGTGGTFTTGTHATTSGTAITGRFYGTTTKYAQFRVATDPPGGGVPGDPPSGLFTDATSTYSAGMKPRLTFVHNQYLIVVGNGGDLYVATHSGTVGSAPAVSSIADNRATYTSSQIPKGSTLSVTFSATTASTKPKWPYDPDAPTGVDGTLGANAEIHLSYDDFATWVTKPAYYAPTFTRLTNSDSGTIPSGQDWIYPTTTYGWTANYQVTQTGTLKYRISFEDANGTTVSSTSTGITTITSAARGIIKRAASDTRYFEYGLSGAFYWPVGGNASEIGDNQSNLTDIDMDDGHSGNATSMAAWASTGGVNFMRWFASTMGIQSNAGSPWLDGNARTRLAMLARDGVTADTGSGSDAAWRLDNRSYAITTTGTLTSGSFTITIDGQTTAAIPYTAAGDTVFGALKALSNVGDPNMFVDLAGGPTMATAGTVVRFYPSPDCALPTTVSITSSVGGGSIALTSTALGIGSTFIRDGWLKRSPAVKPSTVYKFTIRYRIPTTLVAASGSASGLTVKLDTNWVNDPPTFGVSGTGSYITSSTSGSGGTAQKALTNTGSGWADLVGYWAAGSGVRYLPYIYVVLENISTSSGGQVAYVDSIKIEETNGSGVVNGPQVNNRWDADFHQEWDEYAAANLDLILTEAQTNNIALKLVIDGADAIIGSFTDTNGVDIASNDDFYGPTDQSITRGRWWLRAWWRYVAARWSHFSSVHSWELMNEGDPLNGRHANLAQMFGTMLGQKANRWANSHLTTTSHYHSYPRKFWVDAGLQQSAYGVDYSDFHLYVRDPAQYSGTQTYRSDLLSYDGSNATNINIYQDDTVDNSVATGYTTCDWRDPPMNLKRMGDQVGANGTQGLGAPVMRGETGLYDTSTDSPATTVASDTGLIWLRKECWGQLHESGLMDPSWWYWRTHLYDRSDGSPNNLAKLKPWSDFVTSLDLNTGGFVAAAATTPHSELRATGLKHTTSGKAYLWVDHLINRWTDVVAGTSITGRSGNVTVGSMPNGTYDVVWWTTTTGSTSTTTATASGGTLTLALPSALSTDIAVKATLQSGSAVTGTVVIVLPSSSLSATGAGGGRMPSITNAARNAAVDGITGLINAGTPPGLLKIYAGTVPTDVNTSLGAAVLLGTLTFSTTSFGASSSGTATAATITADSSADATGTATFFRITNAAGTAILQGTVGTSGADMNLNTTSIVTGATLSVTSMTITEPAT